MDNLQDRVNEIITKHDPIGLIKLGSPGDEYLPEVKIILQKIDECRSPEELTTLIYKTFVKKFEYSYSAKDLKKNIRKSRHTDKGGAGKRKDYLKIAEEIYPILK
jgi:hypothetical protein